MDGKYNVTMPDPRPDDPVARWLANENAIADAHALKSGDEDPIARIERLEREQDEIEYEMGIEYLRWRNFDAK